MTTVTELFDSYPVEDSVVEIQRNEELLFTRPQLGPIKLREHELLQVVHFPLEFFSRKFSPPQGVYESEYIRIEWQLMDDIRQPFYHRNLDVDELSYQVCGDRTLMTEGGTVELRPGDFSRIPVGVAHDNFGRADIHLLFYIPSPVTECLPSKEVGQKRIPPFEGWSPRTLPEVTTQCLGGPDCDASLNLVDETMLLQQAEHARDCDRIQVIKPSGNVGEQEWLYKSKHIWIGFQKNKSGQANVHRRHRRADEIQCQVKGKRTLVSQYGMVELVPGDFIAIPAGVTFTDIIHEESEHISILTQYPAPVKAPVVKQAKPTTMSAIADLRK